MRRPRQLRGNATTAPTNSCGTRASRARSAETNSCPRFITHVGDGVHRRTHLRRQAAIREHRQLTGKIRADHGPARRRQPRRRAFEEELGDLRRFECGVDGAHDVDQGVAPSTRLRSAR